MCAGVRLGEGVNPSDDAVDDVENESLEWFDGGLEGGSEFGEADGQRVDNLVDKAAEEVCLFGHGSAEAVRHTLGERFDCGNAVDRAFCHELHGLWNRDAKFFGEQVPSGNPGLGELHHFFGRCFALGLDLADCGNDAVEGVCGSADGGNGVAGCLHRRYDFVAGHAHREQTFGAVLQPFEVERRGPGEVGEVLQKFLNVLSGR